MFSIDINGLKAVNDTLGHSAGDELIRAAARCISQVLGRYGKCYRIGGDEFIAILRVEKEKIAEIQKSFDAVQEKQNAKGGNGVSLSLGYPSPGNPRSFP